MHSVILSSVQQIFQDIPYSVKIATLVVLGLAIFYLTIQYLLRRLFSKIRFLIKEIAVPIDRLNAPLRFLLPAFGILIFLEFFSVPPETGTILNHILVVWSIAGIAWLVIRIFSILNVVILSRYQLDVEDNLKARQVSTQLSVIERVLSIIVFVLAVSAILMTFDKVREIGVSILASAGIAGIIIGFAAQRSLATLIAGIQIAITQPIRIDDVVIVENEWGWIEEITLTYVVVRIWDQRRLVVPITYFIERPFQNWTRQSADLLGTVYLYADYGLPIDELRQELNRILNTSPLWDGRVSKIDVTNATERTMELRVLVSAETSPKAWDLRCMVREKLIDFMQRNHPEKLPRIRLERQQADAANR